MKNLLVAAFLITAMSVNAQPLEKNKERPSFTPNQIAELQTKKMTLQLELTEKQQQKILEINKRNATKRKQKLESRKELREKGEKLSSEELFERKSSQLDAQIAHQDEMKTILNATQFETWKKTRARKKMQLKKRVKKQRMKKRLRSHGRQHQRIRK